MNQRRAWMLLGAIGLLAFASFRLDATALAGVRSNGLQALRSEVRSANLELFAPANYPAGAFDGPSYNVDYGQAAVFVLRPGEAVKIDADIAYSAWGQSVILHELPTSDHAIPLNPQVNNPVNKEVHCLKDLENATRTDKAYMISAYAWYGNLPAWRQVPMVKRTPPDAPGGGVVNFLGPDGAPGAPAPGPAGNVRVTYTFSPSPNATSLTCDKPAGASVVCNLVGQNLDLATQLKLQLPAGAPVASTKFDAGADDSKGTATFKKSDYLRLQQGQQYPIVLVSNGKDITTDRNFTP